MFDPVTDEEEYYSKYNCAFDNDIRFLLYRFMS